MDEEKSLRQQEEERNGHLEIKWPFVGKVLSIRQEIVEIQNKKKKTWEIVQRPDAVVLLPIISDEKLLMIKQFRRATNKIFLELPAGVLEDDESLESCAQRELQEETGYFAKKMISFGMMYSSPGFCTEKLYLFLAKQLESNPLPQDEDEAIDLVYIHLNEALKLIESGEIVDAKSIVGILKYVRFLNR